MKNIQRYRKLSQIIFLALLVIGVYMDLRMVLILFLPASFIFGNFFCGWACPYGTMQDFFGLIGKKLFKKRIKMPKSIQNYLQYTRYALMLFSFTGLLSIVFENINGYGSFLGVWAEGFTLTGASIVMLSLLVIGLLFDRPYCNYLCSEGIKYGVFSFTRIFSIKRNEDSCINCKKCDKACPMNIEVSAKAHVRNAQCINCFECVSACPKAETLTYSKVAFPKLKKKSK